MHRQARIGKPCHQLPRAARMIQMDMREDDEVHLRGRDALCLERGQHLRHRVRGSGVDDRGASVLNQQVDRGLHCAVVDAVNRADAVAIVEYAGGRTHRRHYRIAA